MASEARRTVDGEGSGDGPKPMDHEQYIAFLQEGIDDLDAGRWVDQSVIKADIAAMRAELKQR